MSDRIEQAEAAVYGCHLKIEKLEGHLDGAREALANAEAHLAYVREHPDEEEPAGGDQVDAAAGHAAAHGTASL